MRTLATKGRYELNIFKGIDDIGCLEEIAKARVLTNNLYSNPKCKLNLDPFDFHYEHLFISNNENNEIVGAYRLANGPEIFRIYGLDGFYLYKSFKFGKHKRMIKSSLEIGSGFVLPKYQKEDAPFTLLWGGISYYFHQHENLQHMTGSFRLLKDLNPNSIDMICSYLFKHHSLSLIHI